MPDRRNLPLFAWGDALRAARRRRRLLARLATAIALGSAVLAATIAAPPRPLLLWNASASAPLGLYWVGPATAIGRGDMVVARTPVTVRSLAAQRGYIPANVPLVKRAVGVSGDRVCALGQTIFVNGTEVATRRPVDSQNRPLPWWQGCITLPDGALFLLMAKTPASFDGRYFGPTQAADVIGKALPLWVG